MKKKIFPALLGLMMTVGFLSGIKATEKEEPIVDNIQYGEHVVTDLNTPTTTSEGAWDPESGAPNTIYIHYYNEDGKCASRDFYLWINGVNGNDYRPDNVSSDGTEMDITLDMTDEFAHLSSAVEIRMIIKYRGTWVGQSEDIIINFSDFPADDTGRVEIWAVPGEGSSVFLFKTEAETKVDKVETAKFVDWKTIECVATAQPLYYKVYAYDLNYHKMNDTYKESRKELFLYKSATAPECNVTKVYDDNGYLIKRLHTFRIELNYNIRINVQYVVETEYANFLGIVNKKEVAFENLYDNARFDSLYTYEGNDLGVTYTKDATTFKVWAPTSAYALVNIYEVGTPANIGGNDKCRSYAMGFEQGGIYSVTIRGDLAGKYYTYTVINSNGKVEVMDPYAKACGVSGLRGYVCDFDATDPEGWDSVPEVWDGVPGYDIKTPNELSVYEIHVRDLTMDDTWTGESPRGTYQAFAEPGTTYTQNGKTVTTGFDHIEELGVKAIQILPFFDNDNDETNYKFNWGYNPVNYNCLEGGYSVDPHDGELRVKEFKNLVKAYATNDNKTRVIMDVVYNHVSTASNSCFTKIMPRYFFRFDENWNYYDGSGCSNEVRTEAKMMRKYIVDSVLWWASEYKIKGFRFDLMGLIDTETMRAVKDSLYKLDKDIVVWGEGWTAAGYHGEEGTSGVFTGDVYSKLYATTDSPGHIAAFNDQGRNATKGGNDQGWGTNIPYPGWGFISQGTNDVGGNASVIGDMIRGITTGAGANPNQTVNYVSCHDNYTLFDQLNYSLAEDPGMDPPAEKEPNPLMVAEASTACHAAVFSSNGVAFMQGGEELFRSKVQDNPEAIPYPDLPSWSSDPEQEVCTNGDVRMFGKIISHNSYQSSDVCNSFKWDRKIAIEYRGNDVDVSGLFDKYKQMVRLHNELPKYGFPDNTTDVTYIQTDYVHNGSSAMRVSIGNYVLYFSGRSGGTVVHLGGTNIFQSYAIGSKYSISGSNINLQPFAFVVFKR